MPTSAQSRSATHKSRTGKKASRNSKSSSSRNANRRQVARSSRARRSASRSQSLTSVTISKIKSISSEAWGSFLVAASVLLGLAIFTRLAGPTGFFLTRISTLGFGIGRFGLPLLFLVAGIELIRSSGRPGRASVSFLGLLLVTVALLDLFQTEAIAISSDSAGGLVGSMLAVGVASVVGRWGAALIFLFAGFILALLFSGSSISDVVKHIRRILANRDRKGVSELAGAGAGHDRGDGARESEVFPATAAEKIFDFDSVAEPVRKSNGPIRGNRSNFAPPTVIEEGGQIAMALEVETYPDDAKYRLPELALLRKSPNSTSIDETFLTETGRVLESTLRQFDVDATLSGVTPGPTVTRFEVELAPGVKVAKIKGLSDDIAYALAAERVRIQAPIPGKSAIGIEIPNRQRQLVTLGDILSSGQARSAVHALECALGKDIAGRPVIINLAQMPHLLIAGTTGGGKSSTINSLVTSLIMRNGPDRVRLILVDPKRVELGAYDGVPHLLTRVVTNPKRASDALAWAVREMERRYDILAEAGARDLVSYNHALASGNLDEGLERKSSMGYIVVVVDELNDLMMVAARDVEDSIMRLAQMARAVGIHLVIATQRPSTNVITGVIKANIPSRIAFKVGSQVDSRVILDSGGAERLVGMGDMLLLTASASSPRRIQGCFVTEDEVRKVVAFWRRQAEPSYLDAEIFSGEELGVSGISNLEETDELLDQAIELVVRSQLGSTSMLQRKLRVGFSRAGRLMDLMERKGIVGPSEGSKARTVLMSVEEYEAGQAKTGVH